MFLSKKLTPKMGVHDECQFVLIIITIKNIFVK